MTHNKNRLTKEQKVMTGRILATVVLLIAVSVLPGEGGEDRVTAVQAVIYATAYLLIGYDILYRAVTRLAGRHVFDENFLMVVASLGAFALKDYTEGIAVLLLYQIGELFEDIAIERSRAALREAASGQAGDLRAQGAGERRERRIREGLGHDHGGHAHEEGASRSEQFISRFARIYTPVVCFGALILAVGIPAARLAAGMDPLWSDWVYRALTFLVISCPCAMVISIPLGFSAGIGAAGREGIYLRDSVALEELAKSDRDDAGRRIARKTMRIVRENIWASIGIKVICLLLGAFGYAPIWLAIFADDGVMILAVLNSMRAFMRPEAA